MGRRWAQTALCMGVFGCCDAFAHHSGAMFDLETHIELRGVVVDFKLRSPHASFVVEAQAFLDDEPLDAAQTWEVEWESAPMLKTLGIDGDTFAPGDGITILALPHRDRSFRFAHALRVTDEFGTVYLMADSDRKFAPSVRRAAAAATGEAVDEDASTSPATAAGLVGRWQQPLLEFPASSPKFSLNEAGLAAWRSFDHRESPANTCEPLNVPSVFLAPFFMFELTVDQQRVTLRNEAYNVVRTIPLGGLPTAVDSEGWFGRATAQIVDGVLTVTSRDFKPSGWGLGHDEALGGADLPSSEQKALIERFAVIENGRTLVYTYELFDPVYMTETYVGRVELTRAPDNTPIYPYDCDPESAAMWSRHRTDPPLRSDR